MEKYKFIGNNDRLTEINEKIRAGLQNDGLLLFKVAKSTMERPLLTQNIYLENSMQTLPLLIMALIALLLTGAEAAAFYVTFIFKGKILETLVSSAFIFFCGIGTIVGILLNILILFDVCFSFSSTQGWIKPIWYIFLSIATLAFIILAFNKFRWS